MYLVNPVNFVYSQSLTNLKDSENIDTLLRLKKGKINKLVQKEIKIDYSIMDKILLISFLTIYFLLKS